MRRYKNYTELLAESKKIDCCTKMENETFPTIPDPDEIPKRKLNIIEGEGLSKLDYLEIAEARKSVRWFKKCQS